ncbi:STAS domain-containing protein [Neptuniibacter sp. QD72_48]|uniref:STAS domain-containing protein n=1 Tax=unclassified Neptuniibacter TaxID=2630693 RepID=UPI0039F70B8A
MIQSHLNQDTQELTISIGERFDYSIHKAFRDAYRDIKTPRTNIAINLSSTKYIDSSALGMLLIAKEHAENINGVVTLVRPSETALRILKLANFDQLFKVV